MEKRNFNYRWLFLLSLPFFSGSCVAALPLMMVASAGLSAHSVTKVVQMTTDGDITMAIGENEIASQTKLVLSDISRLALWPDDDMVLVAEELENAKIFDLIATPSKTGKVISESGFSDKVRGLTYSEKMVAFQTVCEKTGTEAIVAFEDLGHEANMRYWSFSRSSMDFKGKIVIFELRNKQIIFSSIMEMKINLGGSTPNQQEMMAKVGKMLAQKIIELKMGPMIATKE